MIEMKMTRLGALEFRYAESPGPNPPILFLHGTTDSLESYLAPLGELVGHFHLFALDFRGHGLSEHSQGRYRIRDHSEDVQAFLATMIRRPTIIAGHSLGALVAAFTAAFAPDLICGAFLEDPPLYTAQMPRIRETSDYQIFLGLREVLSNHTQSGQSVEDLAEVVGAWPIHPMLFDGKPLLEFAGPDVVRARAESLHRVDVGVLDTVLDGTQFDGFAPDDDIARIQCPLHVVAGEASLGGTIDRQDLEHLKSLIPHLTYRVLPGLGHFIHHTAPTLYTQELRSFAEGLR
jgi:pimeloyl-ACP methyl ester carboxylesterase